MDRHFKLLGLYFWLLGLFTIGRWGLSFSGMSYAQATPMFSLVPLALVASAHHAGFARAFRGYGLKDAVMLGVLIGLLTQVVIFASTAISYGLGLSTLWNNPTALNQTSAVSFGSAMVIRAQGMVANTILNSVAALIGYGMGGAIKAK